MSGTLQGWAQVLALGAMVWGALIYQTHHINKTIKRPRDELRRPTLDRDR